MLKIVSILMVSLTLALTTADQTTSIATTPAIYGFEIDYNNNQFLLDGKPFRYVSGSFHYFRTPSVYWRDRLRKMRAAGLNAISTYVEWSLHQPKQNIWNWNGEADIVKFIKIAQEEDLFVILRPGPYICAERDLGGLPAWLMTLIPDIKMRTNDSRYMKYVEIYLNELMSRLEIYLRGNGGPIIMVQVENEYGSFDACDLDYREALRDIIARNVDNKALLYTTDGTGMSYLKCGTVSGAYATIDFGSGANVQSSFEIMRKFEPNGPLVNSEYYSGWLTHWGEPMQRVETTKFIKTLREMLNYNASVNIYMMYGGTNFGLTAGANGGQDQYIPQLTSYDYDAPLTEAGDPTDKYFALHDTLAEYLPMPNLKLPTVAPKGSYNPVNFHDGTKLFSNYGKKLAFKMGNYEKPPTFEEIDNPRGIVLYETHIPNGLNDPAILMADVADRALVYVDDYLIGTLSRTLKINEITIQNPYAQKLQILVENQGHLNFGNIVEDWKGIFNVTIDKKVLTNWTVFAFPLDNVNSIKNMELSNIEPGNLINGPVLLHSTFTVNDELLDTYLDTTGWGKGVVFLNGNNLGRYWPKIGPQVTLYVPGIWLKNGINEVDVLEYEYVPLEMQMKFRRTPNLGKFQFKNKS